jgi:hypothetical protein
VDENLYRDVKTLAAQERRQIAEVIERALAAYVQRSKSPGAGKAGLSRLLDRQPLQVSDAQFREVLELDYFDQ